MAVTARLIRVRSDGMNGSLWLIVAARARRRAIAEGVTVAAAREGRVAMQRHVRGGMATCAHLGSRAREPVVMATVARDLADMRDVACARRDVAVTGGHLLGCAAISRSAAGGDDRDGERHHQDARHGRLPIG